MMTIKDVTKKRTFGGSKRFGIEAVTIDFIEYEEFEQEEVEQLIATVEEEMQIAPTVKLSDLINDNFKEVWHSEESVKIMKGGRSSLKSSYASIRAVMVNQMDPLANIITLRKVAAYLRTSVYAQIAWAISKLNLTDYYTFYKSPLKIERKDTGTGFYFYGVDDPQKIKSTKVINGYVKLVWVEEAAEFKNLEEIDIVLDTFIREVITDDKGDEIEVEQLFTYNPPRNPYHWINEWVESITGLKGYFIHHSTYEDDKKGFLSKQFLNKILTIKKNDPTYHDWMYLGKIIGYGDNVYNFNLFKVIQEIPKDDNIIVLDIVMDTGYSVSSTTFLLIGKTAKGKVILLDTYYYCPENQIKKKAPSDFSKDLNDFTLAARSGYGGRMVDTQVIDSADAALRNQYNKDYGILLTPVKKLKKKDMIANVETLLALGNVYVLDTENNQIFLEEHKKYQWIPETKETDDPQVVKENDHTCDAFQYYVRMNLSKLGLKF